MTRPPTIAAVEYLNAAPLIEGLASVREIDLVRAVPSRIAPMLASDDADVGLVSAADALRADPPMVILPVGMIGCDGPTLTVRLFSRVPLAQATRLHADTDSRTSVELARLILKASFNVEPELVPFDPRERPLRGANDPDEAWPETLLLIGDKVVAGSPPAVRYPHQLDLGEAWKSLTGLPFVYAAWACLPGREHTPPVRTIAALLDRQRRRNAMRMDHVVSRNAPQRGWPRDLADHYIGSLLRYDLDARAAEGLTRFASLCAELGLHASPAPVFAAPPSPAPAGLAGG